VRRDRIELSTRGFSVQPGNPVPPEKNAGSGGEVSGFCTPKDPGEAVKDAIKAAVDAGRLDLAGKLLDVLRDLAPKVAEVVPFDRRRERGRP
jgi:hypothetical protein